MDRLTGGAAFAAIVLSLTLSACGGGSSSTPTGGDSGTPPTGGDVPAVVIEGVSTPSSVSVVTAKNAQ
ncbi:hypothetical protein BURC_01573 [Burkholderiaceae bacterium]|nr:hypothetical protein BURC_01573 [Burkholderiaceae bacterium]